MEILWETCSATEVDFFWNFSVWFTVKSTGIYFPEHQMENIFFTKIKINNFRENPSNRKVFVGIVRNFFLCFI